MYMRKLIYLSLLWALLLASCRKSKENDQITDVWRLEAVYDKSTGTTALKPAGESSDIVIQFADGRFSGHTLRNSFSNGEYTLTGNKITFGFYSMTSVVEESWGSSFHTVLNACGLQSIHPCTPSDFTITGNILEIDSPLRYTITLVRM